MQRFGTAEEVAEAVAFFASRGASYVTGEVMNINGGLYS
jgi:3-oxoacyl-[acyl-carrier protein] reductase